MAYAAHTGTRRNLAAMAAAGWGLLLSPGKPRDHRFPFALDNGAFTAWQQGRSFDAPAFERHVERHGDGAEFVVLPDIVAGGLASLDLSLSWLPRLNGAGRRRLIAVQDGMQPADVMPHLGPDVGIFIGGTTDWKLTTLPLWGKVAREAGAYLHVGRVNSARRIRMCAIAGADSIDGTSATRYAVTLPVLDAAIRQKYFHFDLALEAAP
jgi:hypothetical protein